MVLSRRRGSGKPPVWSEGKAFPSKRCVEAGNCRRQFPGSEGRSPERREDFPLKKMRQTFIIVGITLTFDDKIV